MIASGMIASVGAGCGEPSVVDGGMNRPDSGPVSCVATLDDFPAPVTGRCRASLRDGATETAGDTADGAFLVPGGERLTRVGRNAAVGGFPMRLISIPGTRFVIVTDGGVRDETLTVIDVDTLEVAYEEVFERRAGEALFWGLAISQDARRLWVSAGGTNEVLAYDVDPATGTLTRNPAASFVTAMDNSDGYVSGISVREDGLLAIALLFGDQLLLWDPVTGTERGRVAFETGTMPYDVIFTPEGTHVWVSLWGGRSVVRVDVDTRAVDATVMTGKNPQALAFSPDQTQLAVACSDSDSVEIIDVISGLANETLWVLGERAPRGAAPSALRFGGDGRLYVANALENAIDVFAPGSDGFQRVGAIPTLWHPSDVLPLDDGALVFLNARDTGTGPNFNPGRDDITELLGGSISVLDAGTFDDAMLAAWELEIDANNTRTARLVEVACDEGADYDFPIPRPGEGPSAQIQHVVLVIRENKTYDAYLGDLTDMEGEPLGNGDPSLTLIPSDNIEEILPNTRALAREFALSDNYYSHAEQSIQGHVWTTHGRTTDFVERSWLTTWGRGYWVIPPQGVTDIGSPEEGSAFDFLERHGIDGTNYGEIVGSQTLAPDLGYPGLFYSYEPDIEKADYVAGRIQNDCELRSFTYLLLPNDHTLGGFPTAQTPESMIADNDEGVGRIVDAISHSRFWPNTVIFVIEDDPQDGGDHVDNHRSPLLVISPWARRGHVSSVHTSEASIFRTIQLIFGVTESHTRLWDLAPPLYDSFTSTPNYQPYDSLARRWPRETNADDGSMMSEISQRYDWSRPDEQPGLSRLLWQYFHGTPAPWPVPIEPFEDADEDADESVL